MLTPCPWRSFWGELNAAVCLFLPSAASDLQGEEFLDFSFKSKFEVFGFFRSFLDRLDLLFEFFLVKLDINLLVPGVSWNETLFFIFDFFEKLEFFGIFLIEEDSEISESSRILL